MMKNPNSPTTQVFKSRYFKHVDIMEALLGSNPSYVWRSLCWSRDTLSEGICWKIGKGDKVNIYKDNWIPELKSGRVSTDGANEDRTMVKDFLNNLGEWDYALLSNRFRSYKVDAIRKIRLKGKNIDDKRYWICEKKGHYSVKMGY